MPKKPSDFLNKKRSRGNGDFARPKAKVGRKVKRRAGETDASFQTRQLSITEQSVAKDRAGAKVSRRGLTLDEHLGQLAHHSAKQRTAACDGAREITTAHGDEAWRCFAPLLDGAARLINDDDGATRRAASKLIRDAILPTAYGPGDAVADENARQAAIVAAAPLFAARLGAALSSFDAGCRKEACGVLEALIKNAPDACRRKLAAAASKTLRAPLVNAVRVAGPPKDHEADAYRASLLRCCASVFLEGSPGPFSLAPEADVLEGDDRADGSAVTLYRGVAAADEAAPLSDETTDDGFGKRCVELAGDAVRRATAERATKGAVLRALEELEPLACLARRGRAAFHATRDALARAAPLRVREGARPDADLLAAAEASLVACALDADLKNAPKLAEALAPRLRGAARRSLARRVLLKRDTKAAANMLRAAGLDRADLQAKDARVLASAAQASARRATPARAAGPPAAWCAALASSAARADNTDDADFLLGALVDVARRCSSVDAAVAPHLEALVSNERCWPRAGALLAHLGAVPSEVVRAACATVSADATASIALLDALKARGAVDDAAALLLETTAAALTDAAHATAPGAATASVIFTAAAAASSAEPSRAVLARLAATAADAAAQPRDVAQRRRLARAETLVARLAVSVEPPDDAREAVAAACFRRLAAAERDSTKAEGGRIAIDALAARTALRAASCDLVQRACSGSDAPVKPRCALLALCRLLRDDRVASAFAAAARRAVVTDDESLRDVVRAVEAELTALDTVVA